MDVSLTHTAKTNVTLWMVANTNIIRAAEARPVVGQSLFKYAAKRIAKHLAMAGKQMTRELQVRNDFFGLIFDGRLMQRLGIC